MNQLICIGIASKKYLIFSYDGGKRTVEPYCYGITKKGNEILRAYQIGGYSKSGNPFQWKLFSTSKISNLKISDDGFDKIRAKYNPNDKVMVKIYCKITKN